MTAKTLKSDALLLLTAAIWGFAFVAQRVGMEHVGPLTFNAVRFALGGLTLVPLLVIRNHRARRSDSVPPTRAIPVVLAGGIAGLALTMGASFQQIGIVYTTAGKAGFITGLYVVLAPILGLFWFQWSGAGVWAGALCAVTGLFLLSVQERFTVSLGDSLVLASAFFWAGHVLIIGWLSPKVDSIALAFTQYATCSLLSFAAGLLFESVNLQGFLSATVPILYAGVLSVGIAYTLQVVAQKEAPPAHAAIILSLEAAFAVLGGWVLLGETLSAREIAGCALMLAGVLLSQLSRRPFDNKANQPLG